MNRSVREPDRTCEPSFVRFRATRDPRLREELVRTHMRLAEYLALRFADRGEPLEDLMQVAYLGLLNAIDRYDPSRGTPFGAFASITIVGAIKQHLRDRASAIRLPRQLADRQRTLQRAVEVLTQRLGRAPTIAELTEHTGVTFEEAVAALEAGNARFTLPLETGHADPSLDVARGNDALEATLDRIAIEQAIRRLPPPLQKVLELRYAEDLTQSQIARRLGVSQMTVSRMQREALQRLRRILQGSE